jgi:DNA/RNA-binding domain of Phe-tRNA-synthetase-like protein
MSWPGDVLLELEGWALSWFEVVGRRDPAAPERLAAARARIAAEARSLWRAGDLAADPVVAAIRRLFRRAGTDPTRYRPSSEALLRRLLKGEPLPAIHPLVDVNNLLSVRLRVPCCVMRAGSFTWPVRLRAGLAGESFDSLRGTFDLAGKPLLEDRNGPFGTPITDSHRVEVLSATDRAWLVAYLPEGAQAPGVAGEELAAILAEAPVARLAGETSE